MVWANSKREPHARFRPMSKVGCCGMWAYRRGGLWQDEICPGRGDELFSGCDLLWSERFVLDSFEQIQLMVGLCFVARLVGCLFRG